MIYHRGGEPERALQCHHGTQAMDNSRICHRLVFHERGTGSYNAPINVMPHLPPPEGGGDKGGDLTTFSSNSPPLGLSS